MLGVFLTGWVLTSNARLIRAEHYSVASRTTVIRSAATAATQIVLAFFDPTALGLIIGFCVGFAVQALFLTRAVQGLPGPRSTHRRDRFIMARYASQISLDIPTAVLLGTVLNIMNFLVLDLYSREEVGYYSMAYRVAALPLTLISGALAEVFYQKASASFRETQGFWRELKFNLLLTLSISLFIIVPIGVLAPPIFSIAFGPQWERAGYLVHLPSALAGGATRHRLRSDRTTHHRTCRLAPCDPARAAGGDWAQLCSGQGLAAPHRGVPDLDVTVDGCGLRLLRDSALLDRPPELPGQGSA